MDKTVIKIVTKNVTKNMIVRHDQYVSFIKVFDEQVKKYGLTVQAVREAIRICKDRDVLKEYLSGRESEVADIMITLFSQEEVWDMRVRSKEKEAAIKTTIEDGRDYGIPKEDVLSKLRHKYELSEMDALEKINCIGSNCKMTFF